MAEKPAKPKTVTIELREPDPKKGSVRYSLPKGQAGIITNIYVERLDAMKSLGIEELDAVKGFKVTLEPILA